MAASISTNSWNRYNAALSSWASFIKFSGKTYSWPLEVSLLRGYVDWAISVKQLQPNTVRIYLSDLKMAHELKNKDTTHFNDFFIKKMLKGADHLNMYKNMKKKAKVVMTFQML